MEEEPPALVARNVSKAFSGTVALRDFELTIPTGEIHALVGENGSGKSTFIKILSGYHAPEQGSKVQIAGRPLDFGSPKSSLGLGCRVVHQDLGLVDSSSVLDNLFLTTGFPHRLGMIKRSTAARLAAEDLERVGLSLDPLRLVESLSPAEKTGVAVARALRFKGGVPVRLLVLDEPTATLPEAEVDGLLQIVRTTADAGVGILYISHRLEEVLTVASRVTILRDGQKMATRFTSELDRSELITLLVGSEIDNAHGAAQSLHAHNSERILEVENLVAPSITGASFSCRAGEIVGIAGVTGSGRDALLSAIFGASPRLRGTVRICGSELPAGRPDLMIKRGAAYLPSDRRRHSGLMEMSALENFTIADLRPVWGRIGWRRSASIQEASSWFSRLQVRPSEAYDLALQSFSGGNQQKILLAKWLRLNPRLILLDEPTQGVDMGARAILHAELIEAAREGAAVVCSSTDIDEIAALCQRVLVLGNGRIAAILEGEQVTVSGISEAVQRAASGSRNAA